jgi:subtilase family serine protease
MPGDNARHVPDVSLAASADHDGYIVYTGGQRQIYGGTSAPTPSFAGIAALLNQYLVARGVQSSPGLGNLNPQLYSLAQTTTGVFHDVTTGDNIVTVGCSGRSAFCNASPVGFNAAPGYDQTTGLGSVDAYGLATSWTSSSASLRPVDSITLVASPLTASSKGVIFVTATVTASDGTTPSGYVTFVSNGSVLGTAALVGSAGVATATLNVAASGLPSGSSTISATFTPAGSSAVNAALGVSVNSSTFSSSAPSISSVANGASFTQAFAPGAILSVFGSQLAPSTKQAKKKKKKIKGKMI